LSEPIPFNPPTSEINSGSRHRSSAILYESLGSSQSAWRSDHRSSPSDKKVAKVHSLEILAMDLDVKLLQTPEGRNHLIIITRGQIDAEGLELIFRQVAETIQELFNCKVLIDFENADLRLKPSDIDVLVNRLGPDLRLGNIKIALVSSPEIDELEQLRALSDSLCREDLKAAVFDYAKEAVTWLVDIEVC
jgi:predicted nuclease of predicted toxin-antitoxin system